MSLPFLRPSPPPSAAYLRSLCLRPRPSMRSSLLRQQASLHTTRRWHNVEPSSAASAQPTPSDHTYASGTKSTATKVAETTTNTKIGSAPSLPSSTASSTKFPPSSSSPSQSSPSAPLEPLPFFVHRTASQSLPVYHDRKAGGSLKQTVVRRIEGDRAALRRRLLAALPDVLSAETVKINPLTGHIVIKGHVAKQVAGVLRDLHF